MKVRLVDIAAGEELLVAKCLRCPTAFAVAAVSKEYSGMVEARCFDCDAVLAFYTSKRGDSRAIWALESVEKETGALRSAAV